MVALLGGRLGGFGGGTGHAPGGYYGVGGEGGKGWFQEIGSARSAANVSMGAKE